MSSVAAEIGSTANNYRILAKLATGGMADIFLARGAGVGGIERYVVLKRVLREKAGDAHFVQMFLEEARLAAQLNHPNVAQVFDLGRLGDSYFFTMEFVHGETVRTLLQRVRATQQTVPVAHVLTVIGGAAAGLHHAHARLGVDGRPLGVVHRDVSPSNLMVSFEGSVKVVDFGVAKAENRAEKTKTGAVKGKISYLSPEQCRGVPIDRRSDLFSLGVVLWEMLTTERLYRRGSDFDDMTAIVTEPPLAPSVLRPGLAPEVDALTLRLLAKRPEERFQTADELIEAIEDIAKRHGALLSSTGLGRFMRELFGTKKEPWLELDKIKADEAMPRDGVTVTSEPIPRELAAEVLARAIASGQPLAPKLPPLLGADPALVPDELPTVRARPKDMAAILAALPVLSPSLLVEEPPPPPGQPPAWATRVGASPVVDETSLVGAMPLRPAPRKRTWVPAIFALIAVAVAVAAAVVISRGEQTVVPPDAAVVAPDASVIVVQPIDAPDAAVTIDAEVAAPIDAAVEASALPDAAVERSDDTKPKGDKKVPKGRPKPPKKDCAKDPMSCQH